MIDLFENIKQFFFQELKVLFFLIFLYFCSRKIYLFFNKTDLTIHI